MIGGPQGGDFAGSSWQRANPGNHSGSSANPFGAPEEYEGYRADQEDADRFAVLVAAYDPERMPRAAELYAKGPVKAWYAYFNDFQVKREVLAYLWRSDCYDTVAQTA
jgi:hypothetical protein